MTGHFPKPGEVVPTAPLTLAWSPVSGLLQLRHTCSLPEMYGDNYGYRTSLNSEMVKHVERKVYRLRRQVELNAGDVVLDIGSNDGALLGFYPNDVRRIGIDPTAEKFRRYYKRGIDIVPDFFSAERFREVVGRGFAGRWTMATRLLLRPSALRLNPLPDLAQRRAKGYAGITAGLFQLLRRPRESPPVPIREQRIARHLLRRRQ